MTLQLTGRNVTSATMTIVSIPNPYLYFKRNETIYPSITPIGSIIQYGGIRPPIGYLLCDGASYGGTGIFLDLYNVIGNFYGGTTSTSFDVPDFRQRFPVGTAATTSIAGLGSTPAVSFAEGGSSMITALQIPGHTHPTTHSLTTAFSNAAVSDTRVLKTAPATCGITGPGNRLSGDGSAFSGGNAAGVKFYTNTIGAGSEIFITVPSITVSSSSGTITFSGSTTNTGTVSVNANTGDGAYWQPHTAVNFIIKY